MHVYEFLYRGRATPDDLPSWHVLLMNEDTGTDAFGRPRAPEVSDAMTPGQAEALGFSLPTIIGEVNATAIEEARRLASVDAENARLAEALSTAASENVRLVEALEGLGLERATLQAKIERLALELNIERQNLAGARSEIAALKTEAGPVSDPA